MIFADILFHFTCPHLLTVIASSDKLTHFQNHIYQKMSGPNPHTYHHYLPRSLTKTVGSCITPSIIPEPLFSILSHTGASSQCEGGILFDRPAQMLNDSDTKRGPSTQVLTGLFSIQKRLDLT
ncbi:hypothetical protein ILYODFUR_010109 [Ilyodon furcidens]|uniref:Uncharacterized protein n=1 Tax=Ilyodon furcidens TaxID=33524 RepID=A0ABV0U604_9TELE